MTAVAGLCVQHPTAPALVATALVVAGTFLRIEIEERLLSSDPEYADYRRRVTWRLLPGIW